MQSNTHFTYATSYGPVIKSLKSSGFDCRLKSHEKNFNVSRAASCFFIGLLAFVLFLWSALENSRRGLTSEALTLFGGAIIFKAYCITILIIWRKSNLFYLLFDEMEALTNDCFEDTKPVEKIARSCVDLTKKLTSLWVMAMQAILVWYPTVWIAVLLRNQMRGVYKSTYLVLDLLLPGDRQILTPYNELLNVFMVLTFYIICNGYGGWNALLFSHLIFVKCQFDAIGAKIMELFEDCNDEESLREKLSTVIKWHQRIIKLTKLLGSAYSIYIATVQFYMAVIMCVCVFIIFNIVENGNGEKLAFLVLPGSMMMSFLMCKLGHEVSESSLNVGTAVYNSNWDCYPSPRIRRTLMIIMLRSQHPVKVESSSIFVLDLNTFMTIVKSAYSYYTFLRST